MVAKKCSALTVFAVICSTLAEFDIIVNLQSPMAIHLYKHTGLKSRLLRRTHSHKWHTYSILHYIYNTTLSNGNTLLQPHRLEIKVAGKYTHHSIYSHIWYTYGILHNIYNTIFLIHFAKVCKNRVWLGQLYIWSIYSTHARVSLIFLYPVVGEGNSGKCMSAEICCPAIIIHSHGRAFLYRALLVHFFTKKITELNMIWKRSGVVITLSLR